ncbi:MAG: polyhydroxyalkanoate synthesis repressor PhaR, partial [Pseudomonadota bacterium]
DQMGAMNPMTNMPGYEAMKAQQEAFLKAMTGGMGVSPGMANWSGPAPEAETDEEDLQEIKRQLAELQEKLAKL